MTLKEECISEREQTTWFSPYTLLLNTLTEMSVHCTKTNKRCNVCINVTLRCNHVTSVAVEKQYLLHILSVCLQPQLSSMQCACTVLYCHLWPVWLCGIFPHYLINGKNFGEKQFLNKNVPLVSSTTSVRHVSHFSKNSTRYYHK